MDHVNEVYNHQLRSINRLYAHDADTGVGKEEEEKDEEEKVRIHDADTGVGKEEEAKEEEEKEEVEAHLLKRI